LIATNRIVGRVTALHIAFASMASDFAFYIRFHIDPRDQPPIMTHGRQLARRMIRAAASFHSSLAGINLWKKWQ